MIHHPQTIAAHYYQAPLIIIPQTPPPLFTHSPLISDDDADAFTSVITPRVLPHAAVDH
jgi:hypothetical protein